MNAPMLCVVTPGQRPANEDERGYAVAVGHLIAQAIAAGLDLVQVREPHLPTQILVDVVGAAVAGARAMPTRILVNDRVDVALTTGAAGVHLGSRSVPAPRVREISPDGFLVGRSVHSVQEARAVGTQGGVDYLIAGTVFASRSKPAGMPLLGVSGLTSIVAAVRLPVLAIGGIELDHVPSIARVGAAGLAAIGLFQQASVAGRLAEVAKQARAAFDSRRYDSLS